MGSFAGRKTIRAGAVLICVFLCMNLFLSGCGSAKAKKRTSEKDTESRKTAAEQTVRIPHESTRYYIAQFDERMLDNFRQLYGAVIDHSDSCTFENGMKKEELEALVFALKYDCPELFCFDNAERYYEDRSSDRGIFKVELKYRMSKSEYQEKYPEMEQAVQQIVKAAEAAGSSYRKQMAAYEYLTQQCAYNDRTDNCGCAYGAVMDKKAKCDGISLAYKWILEEMGENCFVDAGRAPGDKIGHAWNVTGQAGSYYATDLTADLMKGDKVEKTENWYPAFQVSLDWVRDQYDLSEVPGYFRTAENPDMSKSYHAQNGSLCRSDDDKYQKIYDLIERTSGSGDHKGLLQFESEDGFEYFGKKCESIVTDWAQKNSSNIEFQCRTLDHYRTVYLEMLSSH